MNTNKLAGFLAVMTFAVLTADSAEAFYHAGMGRFLNRDPGGQVSPRLGAAAIRGMAMYQSGMFVPRDIAPPFGMTYVDGYNLYQYTNSRPTRLTDPTGLKGYDPGPNYPYTCPKEDPKKPCDVDDFRWKRWWAGVHTHIRFGQGSGEDGKMINAFAHCYYACTVHRDMPECDNRQERTEWDNGRPADTANQPGIHADLDIRNNNIGRDITDAGKDCWSGCMENLEGGTLWCDDGNGNPVKCDKYSEGLDVGDCCF